MFPLGLTSINPNGPQWWRAYCLATLVNTISANRADLLDQWATALGATDLLFLAPDDLLLSGVGIVSDGHEAIVGFQGTGNVWQLLTEIILTPQTTSPGVPGNVHGYFGACFQSRLAAMTPTIAALPAGYHTLWTGHSAGAAIAEVACKYFCTNGPLHSTGLVSFGAPRAGNAAFAAASTVPLLRVVAQQDFIPSLPPPIATTLALLGPIANSVFGWNYVHSSWGWILNDDGSTSRGTTNIIDRWGPANPIAALRLSAAWSTCLAAHAIRNYCARLLPLAVRQGSPISLEPMIAINTAIG